MKHFRFLFSGTLMGILLVIFAIAIGYATFIENDFDSTTAKMLIYNARWFEVLLLLMMINFAGMIFTRQLYRKSKINILVIHLSLVIIIIGAAITRYLGFEGQMHIRQGQTTDRYLSFDTYFNVHIDDGTEESSENKRIWLSPVQKSLYSEKVEFKNLSFDVSMDRYFPNAVESLIPDANGSPIISLISSGRNGRFDGIINYGQLITLNGFQISFGDTTQRANIQFILRDGGLLWRAPHFHDNTNGNIAPHEEPRFQPISPMQVIDYSGISLMVKDFSEKATYTYTPVNNENQRGIRVAKVRINENDFFLKYGEWEQLKIDGVTVSVKFGNQTWILPFSLKLNEFQLQRYPGSMSPSSFASEITLIDTKNQIEKPYRIFMNNILEYQGYRFYQSSYDQDEKGTILSVNHDYWGTLVTYIGYFLLFGSLIISLFTRKTRFVRVSQQIKETHEKRKKLLIGAIAFFIISFSSFEVIGQDQNRLSKQHAEKFGKLLLQNKDGRIVPVNTIAIQSLVKVYKKSSFDNLSADQVFLGMISNPTHWQNRKMIKVGDPALQSMLGATGKFAAYSDFFDDHGQYKLKQQIDEAYAKKPALRNMFDKELIYVDERVNVCYMVYNGSLLKVFPIPGDPNNTWISPLVQEERNRHSSTDFLRLFGNYITQLNEGIASNNYIAAEAVLQEIKEYQLKEGAAIIPPQTKINLEVLYNKMNIFKSLFPVFFMLGFLLFAFLFTQIFKPKYEFKWIIRILVGFAALAFAAQTFGLGLRWYISGHAPWSNGYESMIYVGWGTMLAGFIFMRKAPIVISIAALLTAVILLTAHMSWLNPEITNLVPVLKSYWLTFHVATITASYSFFALACLIGLLNLIIMIFRKKSNLEWVNLTLKELSLIIELSLAIGLVLMVIGNFLGGIWANESWGRYWGWDPKETWSLVTIIVYSFILHMRLIPGLRSTFSFNFLSMFGFSSVLMTYFGVNYYLSGLHSYASGDPVPVPTFVYYTVGIMLLVSVSAAINDFKIKDQSPVLDEAAD